MLCFYRVLVFCSCWSGQLKDHFHSNREIKFDVTWSYVKRQTAKKTSEFVFFSSNPSLNHLKIEKCLLLFATNANIFTLLLRELKTDGKSFIFAVCSLTYDHVTANLISLMIAAHDGKFKTTRYFNVKKTKTISQKRMN